MAAPPSRTSRKLCREAGKRFGFTIEFHCSNHEGVLVDLIQQAGAKKAAGVVINGAGFTTTSISIHDALKAVDMPAIEVPRHQHLRPRSPGAMLR